MNLLGLRVRRPWRPAAEGSPRPWTVPPSLDSFRRVFGQQDFGRYFVNGLVVAGSVVIVSALIALLAATAVTRFHFRFRTTLLIMFLMAWMVPVEVLAIPLFSQMRDFGLLNTLGSLVLPHIAFSLPFAIWRLRGFVKAAPEAFFFPPLCSRAVWPRACSPSSRPGVLQAGRS